MSPRFFIERTESRSNNFDALRYALALWVVYYHAFPICGQTYGNWHDRLLHLQIGGGWLAVNLFFVISGFLIAQSWMRSRSALDYFKKRVLRIYPAFVAALLFCILIVGPLAGADLPRYFGSRATWQFLQPLALKDVVPLPGAFRNAPWPNLVNGSIWTIRFEMICYGLLAVLGTIGLLRRRLAVLVLYLTAVAAAGVRGGHLAGPFLLHVPYFGNLFELPRFVAYFLGGVTFYLYRDRIPCSRYLLALSLCVLVASARFIPDFTLPIFGTYIVFCLAFSRSLPLRNFGKFGDFSYGLYLYAFPVQQLLQSMAPALNPAGHFAIAAAIASALAIVSWYLIEAPFLRLKTRRADRAVSISRSGPTAAPVLQAVEAAQQGTAA